MAWSNVSKPTSSTWTNVYFSGKIGYDDINTTYDESTIYYDGYNPNQWSNVSKPASSTWTKINKPT